MGLICPFIADGENLDEVTKRALEHVLENHRNDFNIMVSPEEIERMEKSLARSTRVVYS
jgi:predicted small metal-binding protein